METLTITTTAKREVIDMTDHIAATLRDGDGVVHVSALHTTVGMTCADLDPGTDLDFLDFLEAITPNVQWRHPHDPAHTPDHMLAALIGPTITMPVRRGKLVLGTWQRIVLVELNGPKERQIVVTQQNE